MNEVPDWRLTSGGGEFHLVPEGVSEAETPTWSGRFERMSFGPGFHMHIGRMDVTADSEMGVAGGGGSAPISAFALLSGRTVVRMDGWPDLTITPKRAVLVVSRARRATFFLPGSQVFRFFSVVLSAELLVSLLDGAVPPELAPLVAADGGEAHVREVSIDPVTQALIAKVGDPRPTGSLERLQREGVALEFLSTLIAHGMEHPPVGTRLTAAEERLIRAARDRLVADLRDPPPAAVLAAMAKLSVRRLLNGFQALYGMTPAQLLRRERLEHARALIESEPLPLKDVAWRVGYGHVSNFVAAFTDHFGMPPRQLQRHRAEGAGKEV